jgi:hypothetical protein
MFQTLTGTKFVHIPYKGSGQAITDLLSGQVALNFDTMPPVLPHIQAGKLKAFAISTPQRLPQLPDVPTFAEVGITGFDVTNWYGVFVPAKNAEGHRQQALRRDQPGDAGSGNETQAGGDRHAAGWRLAAGLRGIPQGGPREVREAREGIEDLDRLRGMAQDFWASSGFRYLERGPAGLVATDAWLARFIEGEELAPPHEAGPRERWLHQRLLRDPRAAVDPDALAAVEDEDARDNWTEFLRFRERLAALPSLEAVYLDLYRRPSVDLAPPFVDALTQAITRSILDGVEDPWLLRAGEMLFRRQRVSTDGGQALAADSVTLEAFAETGGFGNVGPPAQAPEHRASPGQDGRPQPRERARSTSCATRCTASRSTSRRGARAWRRSRASWSAGCATWRVPTSRSSRWSASMMSAGGGTLGST